MKKYIGKRIKSTCIILMLTIVLLSFSIPVSAEQIDNDVWCLAENDGHVEMGDVFDVTFNITINEEINSIGLDNVTFTQTVINGTGTVNQGNALVAGSTVTWITTDWSTNDGGYASPLASWAKTAGTNNSAGYICNTTWNAIAVGVGHINFTDACGTSYGDADKGTVFHNGTVYVHPAHPVSPSATAFNATQINLSWTKGSGADRTVVVAKENSLPVNLNDGTVIYNNTGTSYNHGGLSVGEHWCYRFYSWNTSESMFSVNNVTADTTIATIDSHEAIDGIASAEIICDTYNVSGLYTGSHWDTSANTTFPYGITTNGTNIWIVDKNGDEVYKYDMAGNHISNFDISVYNANPLGIGTDGTNIWIVDYIDFEVCKYTMSGTYVSSFDTTPSGNSDPFGLDTNGTNIWVSDNFNGEIYKYDMAGTYVNNFDTDASGNANPTGIGTDGIHIWVADDVDHKIYKYTIYGTYVNNINISAQSSSCRGLDTDGTNIWITDATDAEVYKYDMVPTFNVFRIIGSSTETNNVPFSNPSINCTGNVTIKVPVSTNVKGIKEVRNNTCGAIATEVDTSAELINNTFWYDSANQFVHIETVDLTTSSSVNWSVNCSYCPFNSTWDTTKEGVSNSTTIKLPLESTGNYNFTVQWGDGNSSEVTSWNSPNATYYYGTEGVYNVSILGTIEGFRFNNGGDKLKITDISQWGILKLGNNNGYFYGCSNLNTSATDELNLTGTTNLSHMFRSASVFNGNISNWNLTGTTNLSHMFRSASVFNGNISNWNTSSVTSMSYMFYGAIAFNQNLSNWDASSVTSMQYMFCAASAFNGSISNWDTSSVTSMSSMFYNASVFNGNISDWNTSSVTSMSYMFKNACDFEQNLGNWNVSAVLDMAEMFNGTTLSVSNYDSLLIGWAGLPSLQDNVNFHGGNSQYSSSGAVTARNDTLIGVYSWVITDGGYLSVAITYVDDDADSGWYNALHVKTIQEGIDNVTSSGTVYVWDGTYNENVIVNKTVSIIGNGSSVVTVDSGGALSAINVTAEWVNVSGVRTNNSGSIFFDNAGIIVNANYTNISNCNSSSNGGDGVIISDYLGHKHNVSIYNCTIYSNADDGIMLRGANNCDIVDNIIRSNVGDAIYPCWVESHNNSIHGNNCTDNNQSIYISFAKDNIIYNNYFGDIALTFSDGGNIWNVTKTSGTNIIGGAYLGGNYWADYTGYDSDGDGLGNTDIPHNCSGNITIGGDYHPLVESSVIWIDITNASWDLGNIVMGSSTWTNETGKTFIADMDNCTINTDLKLQITNDGADWTAATSGNGPDANIYRLNASIDSWVIEFQIVTASVTTISLDIVAGQNETFDLRFDAPTSSSSGDQQSITVTATLVEH